MSDFFRRTWAEISVDAVGRNCRAVKNTLAPGCRLMAVVKADAYGHGALPVARELLQQGADWLAVSNLQEAMHLREGGIAAPLLVLSYTPPEEAARLSLHRITQTVVGPEDALRLEQAAAAAGVTVAVHIKVDTAMSRVGFFYHDAQRDSAVLDDIAAACALPHLHAEGCFTHFSVADEPNGEAETRRQFALFNAALAGLKARGVTFAVRHCCNSAATLRFPEMHLDMVRPGIVLYGLAPAPWMNGLLPLVPAMSLKTVVSLVKTVPAGTPVSYGGVFVTPRRTTLATVPIGYGDGMPRALSNRARMAVGGATAPLVGRVCMDQSMLDVTGIPGVREGDIVTVFGQAPTAEDYAAAAGTIAYEAVCAVSKRVPRIYYRGGVMIGKQEY